MKTTPPTSPLKFRFTTGWQVILSHILGWLAFFTLIIISRPQRFPFPQEQSWGSFPFLIMGWQLILFYLNSYFLIPWVLLRRGVLTYLLSCGVLIFVGVMLFFAHPIKGFPNPMANQGAVFRFLPVILPQVLILGLGAAFRLWLDRMALESKNQEIENENLKTELSFLRSQISPHFLFNVLNGVVALSRKHSDQVEPALIRLSTLMRYMLYETDDHKVTLSHEWEYLESYLELQRMRFGAQVEITVEKQWNNDQILIEPMLLIPFLENAFKHGTQVVGQPRIAVRSYQEGPELHFEVKNTFALSASLSAPDTYKGIGLVNVRRRLELLYPGKFTLITEPDGTWFLAHLTLLTS